MKDAFDALLRHRGAQEGARIEGLFAEDPARAEGFSVEAEGLLFDYSKTMIDARARDLLLDLAERAGVA
ncbi:MAG: glucose-6-phosphate isomerase, partial [Alphaproteobacteria bacterium]